MVQQYSPYAQQQYQGFPQQGGGFGDPSKQLGFPQGGFGDPSQQYGFPPGGGQLPMDMYGQQGQGMGMGQPGRGGAYQQNPDGTVRYNNTSLSGGNGWMSAIFSLKGLAVATGVVLTGLLFHNRKWWPFNKPAEGGGAAAATSSTI